jgi:hypothetical protein
VTQVVLLVVRNSFFFVYQHSDLEGLCLHQLLVLVDKVFLFVLMTLQSAFLVFVQLVIGILYMSQFFMQQTDQNPAFVP